MQTLMVMYVLFGALLVLLAIPLWLQKIPPNGLYGFRVKKTMENEKTWYAVNRYSAPWLIATGLGIVSSALLLSFIPGISVDMYALSVLAVLVVILGAGLTATIRFMNRL